VHDDADDENIPEDEDYISADELDFFYGSTTFGRQVRELDGKKEKKARRKSD